MGAALASGLIGGAPAKEHCSWRAPDLKLSARAGALPGPPTMVPAGTVVLQANAQALALEQGVLGPASPIPTQCLLLKNMFNPAECAPAPHGTPFACSSRPCCRDVFAAVSCPVWSFIPAAPCIGIGAGKSYTSFTVLGMLCRVGTDHLLQLSTQISLCESERRAPCNIVMQALAQYTCCCRETDPEWEKDIESETKDECSKYGAVLHVHVDKNSKARPCPACPISKRAHRRDVLDARTL